MLEITNITVRDKGFSFYKIAQKLNEYGYKTRKGFDFSDVQAKRLYIRFSELSLNYL